MARLLLETRLITKSISSILTTSKWKQYPRYFINVKNDLRHWKQTDVDTDSDLIRGLYLWKNVQYFKNILNFNYLQNKTVEIKTTIQIYLLSFSLILSFLCKYYIKLFLYLVNNQYYY